MRKIIQDSSLFAHDLTSSSLAPAAIDGAAADAEAAFRELKPDIDAVPDGEVVAPSVDVFEATDRARQLHHGVATDAALTRRFHQLAQAGEFDLALLDGLSMRALAAGYARSQLATIDGAQGRAKVPAAIITPAVELRDRMLALASYQFKNHPVEGPVVAQIAAGRGHRDLADDLAALAALFARHAASVARDPVNYRDSDKADAERHAREIRAALGRDPADRRDRAARRAAKAWTFFWSAWAEVAQTGRWLLRRNPARAEQLFPSLVGEVRAAPRPRNPDPAPVDPDAPVTPRAARTKGRRKPR